MLTKEDRHERFVELTASLEVSQGTLAKWMCLTNSKQARETVSRMVRGAVGVTPKDISLLHTLDVLRREGYDLASVEFSDDGDLIMLKKKVQHGSSIVTACSDPMK